VLSMCLMESIHIR